MLAQTTILPTPPSHTRTDLQEVRRVDTHKCHDDAILLDRWRGTGDDSFAIAATWSALHPHYRPEHDGTAGLALMAESLRQSVIMVCHAAFDVAHDQAFVMRSMEVEVVGSPPVLTEATPVRIEVRCEGVDRKGGVLRAMQTILTFSCDGETFARGSGDLTLLPPAVYARLRDGRVAVQHRAPGKRLALELIGCDREEDALIGVDAAGTELVVTLDTAHRWHFDHPSDHVPGMVLVEAGLQAHHLRMGGRRPRSVRATFHRYAEIRADITTRLNVDAHEANVLFEQDHECVAYLRIVSA